ncbi:MAG: hypothetical protein PVH91_07945 [Pseudomonadales bacterium]
MCCGIHGPTLDTACVACAINGRNLTDADQRYASSFIKDFAPQPGRTLEFGVKLAI